MARRAVNPAMLQQLVQGSMNQELPKGSKKSTDPNFPVFSTPVDEDILVYIPRTNLQVGENGETMNLLQSFIHDGKIGKQFVSLRCINGLTGEFFSELGYDGSCPACDGMVEVWELYNAKMAAEAKRLGIDLQNDPNDTMKPIRETILREMDLKGAEEFVTFPICIIPQKARFTPTDDADKNIQTVFVQWRKKRYEESIIKTLSGMMNNPGHPAGMFWLWQFVYDTGGKPATAMLAAKNAKYNAISKGDSAHLEYLIPACEESAKEFTLLKAAEVVVANQFLYKEDLEAEVNKVLAKTRQQLDAVKLGVTGQPALGGGAPQIGAPQNALANFGVAQGQPAVNLGGEPTQTEAPQTSVQGSPVTFG